MITRFLYSDAQATISTAVDSIVFAGVPNKITIAAGKISPGQLTLIADQGTVTGANGKYNWQCPKGTGSVTFSVVHNKQLLTSKQMKLVLVNDPLAYLAGDTLINGTTVLLHQVKRMQALLVKCNYPESRWKVLDFRLTIIRDGQPMYTIKNSGNQLSQATKDQLKKLSAGDLILVDDIAAVGGDISNRRWVPGLKIKVVQ